MRIRFDRVDGFIRYYDGTKYLVLFGFETYNAINDKISFLMIMPRSKIIQMVNCLLEETLNLHNVVILIQSVLNKIKINTTIIYSDKNVSII